MMNLEYMPIFQKLNDELKNIQEIIIKTEDMFSERIVSHLNKNLACSENFSFFAFENKISKSIVDCDRHTFPFTIAVNQTPEFIKKINYRMKDVCVCFLNVNLDIKNRTFTIEQRLDDSIFSNYLEYNSEIFEFVKSMFKISEMIYLNSEALKDIISEILTDEYFEAKSQFSLKKSRVNEFSYDLDMFMARNTLHSIENTIISEMPTNGIILKNTQQTIKTIIKFKYSGNVIKNVIRRNSTSYRDSIDIRHSIMYRNKNILKKN